MEKIKELDMEKSRRVERQLIYQLYDDLTSGEVTPTEAVYMLQHYKHRRVRPSTVQALIHNIKERSVND